MTLEYDNLKHELYMDILNGLRASLKPATVEEGTFVEEVAKLACEASLSHVEQLQQAYLNALATVTRLSKVDTGTTAS